MLVLVIFIFGAGKIPKLARSIGEARREFDKGLKWQVTDENPISPPRPIAETYHEQSDPLVIAAKKEGIQIDGKTREQIASELSWKLNKK